MTKRFTVKAHSLSSYKPTVVGEFDEMGDAMQCVRTNVYSGALVLSVHDDGSDRPTPDVVNQEKLCD